MQRSESPKNVPYPLSEQMLKVLKSLGWGRRVRWKQGIWVCVESQRLLVIKGDWVIKSYVCSTAKRGIGNLMNSNRTPDGWHKIRAKIGAGCPTGAVFRSRIWSGDVWKRGYITNEDLVLSRILRLSGLEGRINRDGKIDTWERMIYIHGTNAEEKLGRPLSKGCIRLSNRDVVELFDLVPVGCRILISPSSEDVKKRRVKREGSPHSVPIT